MRIKLGNWTWRGERELRSAVSLPASQAGVGKLIRTSGLRSEEHLVVAGEMAQ